MRGNMNSQIIPADPRRPARVLINLIGKCPPELIQRISPGSMRLKSNIKVPLVLLAWSSGVLNGCALVFIKVCGEVFNSPEAANHTLFAILIGCLGAMLAGLNMYCLNQNMKYYQNLDVMPLYQSMILMNMLLAGLIVLNES